MNNNIVRWGIIGRTEDALKSFADPILGANADEIINNPDIDAIYIATPPEHHLEYGSKVCKAGKPCLIENPGGRSSEEWDQLIKSFEKAGVPLYISFYRRFLPKFIWVKKILESGKLGTITSIQYRHISPGVNDDWRVEPRKSGGGLFWNVGGHVLDLFEFWFGPLEPLGGTAANIKDSYPVEDVVSVCFRTKGGALGSALWDFTARANDEKVIIQGSLGSLSLSCAHPWAPCVLEVYPQATNRPKRRTLKNRILNKLGRILPWAIREKSRKLTFSFPKIPHIYGPMIGAITESIRGSSTDSKSDHLTSPVSCLRTLRLMDGVLGEYYGGRSGPYWQRSSVWKGRQNRPLIQYEKIAGCLQESAYKLSKDQVIFFLENGYLGPFVCESPLVKTLAESPIPKNTKEHLNDENVRSICSHLSIVSRIAQLLNSKEIKLFKPRFVNKLPQVADGVNLTFPWHQDVGDNNGGYRLDGSPVPTVSVWLSVSGASETSGPMLVVPGSHRRFYGNWRQYIHAKLESDARIMEEINNSRTHAFITKPGEFYIFHSWVLHSSGLNTSSGPRSALNMRFMSGDDQVEPHLASITLSVLSADQHSPTSKLQRQPVNS